MHAKRCKIVFENQEGEQAHDKYRRTDDARGVVLLDTEEHRAKLRQPERVHRRYRPHVLLGGHDQLVVHNVVGVLAQAEQSTGGVQMARHSRAHVHVLTDAAGQGVGESPFEEPS